MMLLTSRKAALRRATLFGGLVAALAAVVLAGAAALASTALASAPIALDAPDNGTAPLIAYDPVSQTTYVAWSDPASTGIDLCILPAGVTACEGGAPLLLTDASAFPESPPSLGSLAVLPGGEAVVIGIEKASNPIAYVSPAGGGAFLTASQGRQNGGEPLADVDDFYQEDNVAPLSSTDMALLGGFSVGDDDFVDTSLTSAAPALTYPNANPSSQYVYNVAGTGPDIAAEQAPAPAPTGEDVVVDVGASSGGPAIPGCVNDDATGYGVVVGKVNGTKAEAGDLNGKVSSGGGGLQGYSLLECAANAPVLAQGGQDGIGLLEEEGPCISGVGSGIGLYYHPFVATATGGSFGPGVKLADVTNETLCGVGTLDLAEDSGTGVYAEWTDGQGLVLDYSGNGGAGWEPSAVVPEPAAGGQDNPVIAGVGGGNAEIAYVGNPGTGSQVFLQPINYAALYAADHPPATPISQPPPPPPAPSSEFKVEAIVSSSGGTVTITIVVTQPGEASLTVTISTSTLANSAAVDAKAKKCKHGQIKLKGKCVPANTVVGKTSAKATAGVPLKLTVNLSSKIKALLKKGKTVHLTGTLTFQSALGGKPTTHTYSLTVKGHKGGHKK
ncbi:MAG TPA: hypothetical protein VG147_10005 [Solirubrobacteraceae bacterium]|nr:hypothetical protein [Solirubrobacteraceae bacterium]